MSETNSKAGLAGGALVFILILILPAIRTVLGFMLDAVSFLFVYTGILFGLLCLAWSFHKAAAFPLDPVTGIGDSPDDKNLLSLLRQIEATEASWKTLFRRGRDHGWRVTRGNSFIFFDDEDRDDTWWTEGVHGVRFDERHKGAPRANSALARIEAHLTELKKQERQQRAALVERFDRWRADVTLRPASQSALWIYVITIVLVTLLWGGWAGAASDSISHFMWLDIGLLRPYYAALGCGTVAALTAHGCVWAALSSGIANPYHGLRLDKTQTGGAESETGWEAHAETEQPPAERGWYDILGVSPTASDDEINRAWKQRVQQNHPDRVAEMDPAFQDLANKRTAELNAARQKGLRGR